jgi:hypothetical protein
MKYSDLAPIIEAQWISPLVATVAGKDIRVDPSAPAVEALQFALAWLEEPNLNLSDASDELRLQAMLKIAAIHHRAQRDDRNLDADDAALGLHDAARELLRVNIDQMIATAPH